MDIENHWSQISSAIVHSGNHNFGEHAHLSPIYATSTFTFDNAEQGMNRFTGAEKGYTYSRFGNPTTAAAATMLAELEAFGLTGEDGHPLQLKAILHASGQAAMATMFLSNLKAGDAILSHYSLYGGTHEFIYNVLPRFGIESHITDMRDTDELPAIIEKIPALKLIHIETPANPTITCIDIEKIVTIAKRYNILVTVDNTFATPYLQQPFKYNADFVFHSTTKFLNGHGTAIGGVLIGKDLPFMNCTAQKFHILLGSNSSPFDAYLLMQGIKTLDLRMEKHCANARIVAEYLLQHPAIEKVNYNGLPSHPDYAITMKQMRLPGAVLSFQLAGGMEAGKRFINRLKMCTRAVSLGTVDTLLSHPASMSHSGMKKEEREKAGISDGLIRMSVGLEAAGDIVTDLEQALK